MEDEVRDYEDVEGPDENGIVRVSFGPWVFGFEKIQGKIRNTFLKRYGKSDLRQEEDLEPTLGETRRAFRLAQEQFQMHNNLRRFLS